MINLILCGGSGTRLWPVSRSLMPKQFVKIFNNQSLFQQTVKRNQKICDDLLIVSNEEQYFLAFAQLEELEQNNNQYLLEPIGRNTAPAIALACFGLNQDEIIFVTPSDHLIKNENQYHKSILRAKELADENNLVTFGIKPTCVETGFGYIKVDDLDNENALGFYEKPNYETANQYFKEGNYYWNSGMFMFKAGVFLQELQKYSPTIYQKSLDAFSNADKNRTIRIKKNDMIQIPEDSIDYAVMEKSKKVKMVQSLFDWSDVGSFDAIYKILEKDENGNSVNPNHISINSKDNLIYGTHRKIATVDLNNLIIVDTPDALLVSNRDSSQKVKEIVKELEKEKSDLSNIHLTGYRPWGSYTVLEDSKGYKIKRIEVQQGKRLSLQKHFHRNEHWVVISGLAKVTIDEKQFTVGENESIYIKKEQVHRLENIGKSLLVLIEVQVGDYTGEDDIVRIEDDYERK